MGRPDDVDSDSYTSACSEFYYANHAIIDKVGNLDGRLGSSGAMAGSDAGGQEWAKQYDAVSGPLVQAGADIGESMGQMANLLNASLKNHRGAEYGAQLDGPPQYQTSTDDGDADPDHWVETLSPGSLPSVSGGTGDNPDLALARRPPGRFPVARRGHREDALCWSGLDLRWPDADVLLLQRRCREVDDRHPEVPEVGDAVAACTNLKGM